jgi:hypothetical protein
MVWLIFILTAAGIVIVANQLAKYGDVIALRTAWEACLLVFC